MKRKVNRVGTSTLTVSLPSKWAREHNLKAGDEIELEEEGNQLKINAFEKAQLSKKEINISEFGFMSNRIIGALYKAGYDEVKILFNSPEEIEIIQKEINKALIGFEIVKQTNNLCIIKLISKELNEEFESMLKRLMWILISISEDSLNAAKSLDENELKNVKSRDTSVNRISDFCRRCVNKNKFSLFKRPAPLYYILEELEKIGDKYRDIMDLLLVKKIKLSKNLLAIYLELNQYLKEFNALMFKFEPNQFKIFGENGKKIELKIIELSQKINKEEIPVFILLNNISSSLFEMNGSLATSII